MAANKRPTLLSVLCILTFIGSGLGVVMYLLLTLAFGAVSELLANIPGASSIMGGGILFFVIALILAALSLFGAIKMWSLKKIGFYLYTIAQILIIVLPMILISTYALNIFGIVITAIFIVLYAINLKVMS